METIRYCVPEDENPHKGHKIEKEDSWQEGMDMVSLFACLTCKTMFEISRFNGL